MRTHIHTDENETPDGLDRLMGRLESPPPPRALVPAILAATTRREGAASRVLARAHAALWGAYIALLLLVAAGAVLLGGALAGSGALDYLAFALSDADLLRASPDLFRDALRETVPWGHVAALAAVFVAWVVVTVRLLRRGATRPTGTTAAAP